MLKPRRVADSVTTMTEFVLPTHANALGNVFGGQVLAWIDLCAAICAQRHTGRTAITAGIDDLSFEQPIRVGQVVRLRACMTAAFRSSVEILVEVEGENAMTGDVWHCVRAFVTFVAVDDELKPTAVPQLELLDERERQLCEDAQQRRAVRLRRRPLPSQPGVSLEPPSGSR